MMHDATDMTDSNQKATTRCNSQMGVFVNRGVTRLLPISSVSFGRYDYAVARDLLDLARFEKCINWKLATLNDVSVVCECVC
jgi:hypothetical protein